MYSEIIGEIYNQYYSMSDYNTGNYRLNSIGWNSSFTGAPYTAEEMTEWRDNTLSIIRSTCPEKILEIACGTGMMLFGLVKDAKKYTGVDIAQEGIKYIKAHLSPQEASRTDLWVMNAAQISNLPDNDYDLAFINSATQYMGPAEEFTQCVEQMTQKVRQNGTIFLGDMKSDWLRELFYKTCLMFNGSSENISTQLEQKYKHDFEFYISLDYISSLAYSIPRVKKAQPILKRGKMPTEMNLFRYDCILYLDEAPDLEYPRIDCTNMSLQEISDAVAADGRNRLRLCGMRNKLIIDIAYAKTGISCDASVTLYIDDVCCLLEKLGFTAYAVPDINGGIDSFDIMISGSGE
ncbi:MAG: class I SAM-dependent methyltransferase [Oscillospiraceae bacterium]|nr:class I SAM-dependent methyltransferase [Oscillospiraceae bacterium]